MPDPVIDNAITGKNTTLILLAHGSRDSRWQETFCALLEKARHRLGAERVYLAYMEMCSPSLLDVSETLWQQGVRNIRLLPLFMSAGGHVSHDIPRLTEQCMMAFEGLEIEVLPPVGEHPSVIGVFLDVMGDALNEADAQPLSSF